MRKTGWAGAAAGLFSVALLLSACSGGGSSTSSSPTGNSTASGSAASTAQPGSGGHPSNGISSPPAGALYFSIQKAARTGAKASFVLVDSHGYVVYTYAGDTAGKPATCTGSCAAIWPPVTGVPLMSQADTSIPGTFATNSAGQITYNGLPLYTFKGEKFNVSHAGGQWKDIAMSCTNIVGGCPTS